MIDKLLLAALLSATLAARHPGHFLPGDSAENALANMVEDLFTKMSQVSQTIEKAAEEHAKSSREAELWLQRSCNETRAGLRKAVRETVAKGIEKNKTIGAFECISSAARAGSEKMDALEGQMGKGIENILEEVVEKLKILQLSMKHLSEYVKNLFIAKSEELERPGSDTKKVLRETKKKLTSLESKLKDVPKKLKASKDGFQRELRSYGFSISVKLWAINNDDTAKIRKCVL